MSPARGSFVNSRTEFKRNGISWERGEGEGRACGRGGTGEWGQESGWERVVSYLYADRLALAIEPPRNNENAITLVLRGRCRAGAAALAVVVDKMLG